MPLKTVTCNAAKQLTVNESKTESIAESKSDSVDVHSDNRILKLLLKLDSDVNVLSDKIDQQTLDIRKEFHDNLNKFESKIEEKVKCLIEDQSVKLSQIEFELENKSRLDKLDEVIVKRVPFNKGEKVLDIFHKIALAIKFEHSHHVLVQNIFRLGVHNNNPPILIRFMSQLLKREFLVKYFAHKSLNLSEIGIISGDLTRNRIFVSDNLTKSNNEIYQKAISLKKDNKISKVNVCAGLIFVLFPNNEALTKITHMDQLDINFNDDSIASNESMDSNATIRNVKT